TANYEADTVSVLQGLGDGSFVRKVDYAVGVSPRAVVAGDFNGDSHLDLAVGNFLSGTISVLLGKGDGTFAAPITVAALPGIATPATADLTGHGHMDLVAGGGSGVAVMLGQGDGTFAVSQMATITQANILTVGDFNADGRPDLIVANRGSNDISVLYGQSRGG